MQNVAKLDEADKARLGDIHQMSKQDWVGIFTDIGISVLSMGGYPAFILVWMTRRRARKDLRHW
jgi:S-formylglutathione hydrolase FrmB